MPTLTEKVRDAGKIIDDILMKNQVQIHPVVSNVDAPHVSIEVLDALRATVRSTPPGKWPFPGSRLVKDKQDRVIDGRARLAAMMLEDRQPESGDWVILARSDDGVKLFVLRSLIGRKHLTPGQIAMFVAQQIASAPREMQDKLKSMGTSAESVERAQRVLRSGNADMIARVISGEIAVSKAAELIKDGKRDESKSTEEQSDDEDNDVEDNAEKKATRPLHVSKKNAKVRGEPEADLVKAWEEFLEAQSACARNAGTIKRKWRPTKAELKLARKNHKKVGDIFVKQKLGPTKTIDL